MIGFDDFIFGFIGVCVIGIAVILGDIFWTEIIKEWKKKK